VKTVSRLRCRRPVNEPFGGLSTAFGHLEPLGGLNSNDTRQLGWFASTLGIDAEQHYGVTPDKIGHLTHYSFCALNARLARLVAIIPVVICFPRGWALMQKLKQNMRLSASAVLFRQ
jgi:hypothetical protein